MAGRAACRSERRARLVCRRKVRSFMRRRPGQLCYAFCAERDGRGQRDVARRAPVVIGQVIRRAMGMASEARRRLRALNVHSRLATRAVARGAGLSGRIDFARMTCVRKSEQALASGRRATPCNGLCVGTVVALLARRFRRHRGRRITGGNPGVATLAEGKQPLVALVRKCTLRFRDRCKCREHGEGSEPASHGLFPAKGPGSRPTVQSKRTVNRRWLQSGPAAPSVR